LWNGLFTESSGTSLHSDIISYKHGQFWAGRAPPPYKAPPYMAAANFVVITNGEGCALNGTAAIDQ